MKNRLFSKKTSGVWSAVCALIVCLCVWFGSVGFGGVGGKDIGGKNSVPTVTASAQSGERVESAENGKNTESVATSPVSSVAPVSSDGYAIAIHRYDVDVTVTKGRRVIVKEVLDVEFLKSGLSMFYKSLPLEGDRYGDITAKCEGNDAFRFYVAKNPDVAGFLDINCVGGASKGSRWTYELGYTMEIAKDDVKNGMILDVVGTGTAVPLSNVSVTMHFPGKVTAYDIYAGGYGSSQSIEDLNGSKSLSNDGKTLVIQAPKLDVVYNAEFGERMAQAITVKFVLEKGALTSHFVTRVFTWELLAVTLCGIGVVALALLIRFLTRKNREVVEVVNVKPPEGMDPMTMGKLLDGTVDGEDVTSMIYYFAERGYLDIDMQEQTGEILLIKRYSMPSNEPAHRLTLFNGLFKAGDRVFINSLANKYYVHIDKAKQQVALKDMPHCDKKSVLGALLCFVLAVGFAVLAPLVVGWARLGVSYTYTLGALFALPVVPVALLSFVAWNYQFKWRDKTKKIIRFALCAIVIFGAAFYMLLVGRHLLTGWEKGVVMLACGACTYFGAKNWSRTEKYNFALGDILGFRNFIVFTEEDKIKFMLEENPQLYYDVLPYAQVLGVTNEWEDKFKNILIESPSWYMGHRYSAFDYYMLNRCMARSMATMTSRPQSNGSSVGRSGGGGSFGGFSGGGHGGGGFGAR
ncbi:MAG: DUF2207 domain-containing protein [Clostridia bacterium]|nr:DUF2207 domain-containing protein [Clostridia bacterium]